MDRKRRSDIVENERMAATGPDSPSTGSMAVLLLLLLLLLNEDASSRRVGAVGRRRQMPCSNIRKTFVVCLDTFNSIKCSIFTAANYSYKHMSH